MFAFLLSAVAISLSGVMAPGPISAATLAAGAWLCDLGWLEVLSWAGFRGSQAFGLRSQKVIAVICAVVLLGFGLKFLGEAGVSLLPPTS